MTRLVHSTVSLTASLSVLLSLLFSLFLLRNTYEHTDPWTYTQPHAHGRTHRYTQTHTNKHTNMYLVDLEHTQTHTRTLHHGIAGNTDMNESRRKRIDRCVDSRSISSDTSDYVRFFEWGKRNIPDMKTLFFLFIFRSSPLSFYVCGFVHGGKWKKDHIAEHLPIFGPFHRMGSGHV